MTSTDQSSDQPMPIAIVGMSCRLPGDVSTLEEFWRLMSRARSGWRPIPKDRFNEDAYYHPNPEKKGCTNATGGYFLNQDIYEFDAPFFNSTAAEAISMDPQQRMLLECVYEALENSGMPKESIIGKNIGVFVGGSPSDYKLKNCRDIDTTPMFDVTGNHASILAGRISYYFDLRGPCHTVDTACSSSLYALHQAVQSIRSGESTQAIVAACHLNILADEFVSMSLSRLLSEQGVTYAFDHRAKSGFARGEGAGCVILKPLNQALSDNDNIRSVIVNTGVNQDGKTLGISNPNGEAQEQLMRQVYGQARIDPKDTGFVEAHGTGTKVGDPIEASAIYKVFGEGRTARKPLYFGSVKTNVGHLENASGVIAVIKAALMLENGFILPNTNFEKANEAIPMGEWNIKVPTTQRPWPADKKFISINNFGFGGSNAHAVLERAPITSSTAPAAKESGIIQPKLFVLSANDEEAAKKIMNGLTIFLEQHPEVFQKSQMQNLAYTLGQRRSHLLWRVAVVASSSSELGFTLNDTQVKPSRASKAPRIGFVFTGQGAQWHAMGRELMDSHPVFASTIQAADNCLRALGSDFSIVKELSLEKEASQIDKAHLSQPVCTAIQLALTDLLKSWSIQPSSVIGHSSGEIGAAYAAGLLSIESSMAIAYYRGQAVLELKSQYPDAAGGMLAVGAGPDELRPLTKMLRRGKAVVACENSPSSSTISGDEEAIDELVAEIEKNQWFNRKLRVDVAYHSHHMERVADFYRRAIKDIKPLSAQNAEFYSSLRGRLIEGKEIDISYWVDNLVCPVKFSISLAALCTNDKPDVLIEIGPHSALEGPVKQSLKALGKEASKITYMPSLVRGKDATVSVMDLAAKVYMKGQSLDFGKVNFSKYESKAPVLLAELTPYPWSHQRYNHQSRIDMQHRQEMFPRHDLLGKLADWSTNIEPTWRNIIRTDDLPWLRDHKMQSLTTFPITGFICMAFEAAAQRARLRDVSFDRFSVRHLQVSMPLLLDDGEEYKITTTLGPYAEGTRSYSDVWDEFRVCSWATNKGWTEHCRGLVGVRSGDDSNVVTTSKDARSNLSSRFTKASENCKHEVSPEAFYKSAHNTGATYGQTFQNTDTIRVSDSEAVTTISVPDTAAVMPFQYESPYIAHPAVLDRYLQLAFAILGAGRSGMKTLYMPSAIRQLDLLASISKSPKFYAFASGSPDFGSPRSTDFNSIGMTSPDATEACISVEGMTLRPLKVEDLMPRSPRQLCFKIDWEQVDDRSELRINEAHLNPVAKLLHGVNGSIGSSTAKRPHQSSPAIVLISDRSETDPFISQLSNLIETNTGHCPSLSTLGGANAANSISVVLSELDSSLLASTNADAFYHVQRILTTSVAVIWVTKGAYKKSTNPESNMALGLLRTVRSETVTRAVTVDLDPDSQLDVASQAALIAEVLERTTVSQETTDADMEYAEHDGKLIVPRIIADPDTNDFIHKETGNAAPYHQSFSQKDRSLKLSIENPGALDSLYFEDGQRSNLGDNEIEIQVAATGMNFKDVVIAMGQLSGSYLGFECSGVVSRLGRGVSDFAIGDRVCAMSEGGYSTFTTCRATSAVKLRDDISFPIAASVPVVYCTAYYGLFELGRLRKGERVLIHAAAGGVGQAAIQLAKMVGAEIFATVGSAEKKRVIMEAYDIPEDHIYYSRNTSFGRALRRATNGQGVDVVLNSLAGDFLRETWDCLGHFGRFIEIGKRDITSNTRLEMANFDKNATFSSVDLTVLAAERPQITRSVLESVMKLLEFGIIKPIQPIAVLGISQLEEAFRALQSGKITGKLVIVPKAGEQVKATHPKTNLVRPDASYLIVGGTGGLGRSIAAWMLRKGAKHVILSSRSGKTDGEVGKAIHDARTQGAHIIVKACDIADSRDVEMMVRDCAETMPPIRGVIHAAMVLKDVLFEKMTFEDYETVIRPKVSGAWNIHNALLGTPLDFFTVLSSAAGVIGNRGQAAYAAANTFLDAFVQYRLRKGLPGSSVDLTAVEGVGYLAENAARSNEILQNLSGDTLNESEVLAIIGAAISGPMANACNSHCLTGLHIDPSAPLPYYASDAKFTHLRNAALATGPQSGTSSGPSLTVSQALRQAQSADEALEIVSNGILEKLSAILMVPLEDMDAARSVTTYGLDSLNAIELRNWITRELQANLQVLELLSSGSLKNLASQVLRKTKIEHRGSVLGG
ncbi:polyketide synthase [Saccharata proteae CBS 121410]|uniref:Polyketide synthase n=1 Tax=Saccharata proteae CBS 121410 TaxID=1314787 RepID=A0A9P4M0N4_9PEZI|nr:polyketide synthase [Saccharata proteae CBS 121410]